MEAKIAIGHSLTLSVIGRRVDLTQTMRVDFNSTDEDCIGTTRIAKKRKERKALNKFTKKMYKINGNCLCSLHRARRSFVIMKMNLRP